MNIGVEHILLECMHCISSKKSPLRSSFEDNCYIRQGFYGTKTLLLSCFAETQTGYVLA